MAVQRTLGPLDLLFLLNLPSPQSASQADLHENNNVKELSDLSTGDVALHLRRLAVPISIGYFFHTMYNVVDTYFAAYLSTDAIAALSLSFPVFFGVIAFSIGLSSGTTALVSHAIGKKEHHLAKTLAMQSIAFAILLSALLSVLGYLLAPRVFETLGATGSYLELCLEYTNTLFLGAVFFLLAGVINATLTSHGVTTPYRNFLIGSFFLNTILDPWFMFGGFGLPPLGMRGIAVATIGTQALGCAYMSREILSRGYLSKMSFSDAIPQRDHVIAIARQGFPASANMATVAAGIFIVTYFVSTFGEAAVAWFGIATRIEQIALLPAIGLNSAALAIIAQNFGAGKIARAKQAWHTGNRYCCYICIAGFFLLQLFATELLQFFTEAPSVVNVGEQHLFVASFSLLAYGLLWMSVYSLQGLQRPVYGFFIGSVRQIIAPLLILPVIIYHWQWSILGVWWAVCGITWASCILTLGYTNYVFRKLEASSVGAEVST